MAFGVKFLNKNQRFQASEEAPSFAYLASGTTPAIAPGASHGEFLTMPSKYQLLFLRIVNNAQQIFMKNISSSNFFIDAPSTNTNSVTVDWFVAAQTEELPNSNGGFGVLVYGPGGSTRVFDTRKRYPRIEQVVTVSSPVVAPGTVYTVDPMTAGGKPYFLANNLAGWFGSEDVGGTQMLVATIIGQPSATEIRLTKHTTALPSGASANQSLNRPARVLLASFPTA